GRCPRRPRSRPLLGLWRNIPRQPPPYARIIRRKMATHIESSEILGGKPAAAIAPRDTVSRSLEQEELRGISRTVAEIHWLLVILVLLYLVFGGVREDAEEAAAVSAGLFFYAALVMSFRYANFYRRETRWKIGLETCGMVIFITWVLWYTDGLASPLLNAYLLPVITSALTLGKVFTVVALVIIGGCYILLGGGIEPAELMSLPFVGAFFAQLAPVVLVAYITTMFSADIRYGLARAKLLSETDDLTGLLNVRGFALAANRLFAQAARHGRATSVLMIDSDHLKSV